MEIINKVNELMHYEFNAINCYISPNDHPMSMTLDDVSDESEYTIDDRKYYSQSYKIKVRGYIIRKEDYSVERVPSRLILSSHDSDASGIVNRRGKNRREDEKVIFMEGFTNKIDVMTKDDHCEVIPIDEKDKPNIIYEPSDDNDNCCEPTPNRYYNKVMKVMMNFDECTTELSFIIDKEMVLTTIETNNVYDFKVIVNGELMNLDNDIRFYESDEITVRITRDNVEESSELYLVGYDPNVAIDKENITESSLDEPSDEEDIMINYPNEDDI
jgi:hypothetical protein